MKHSAIWVIALLATLLSAPLARGETPEANQQLALAMIEAINARDLDALDRIVAPDIVRHSTATPGVVVESLDQFKDFLQADFASVPDSRISVEVIFAGEDKVAGRFLYAGTQTGPMGPFPPSAKRVELPFLGILRIADGKIAEMWVEWDNLHMLSQLGHLQPPDAGTDAEQD